MNKKERLQKNLYSWLDKVDEVEEDLSSLIDGHNIAKSKISKDISDMKLKLRMLENILKHY